MYNIPQKLTAEFLGTFALVFFGEGAICADQFLHGAGGLGLLGTAAAHGLAIAILLPHVVRFNGPAVHTLYAELADQANLSNGDPTEAVARRIVALTRAADLPTTIPGFKGSLMWMKAAKREPNSSRSRATFSQPVVSVTRVMIATTRCCSG